MSEPLICPKCGDEMDDYGCLGELRGRHVRIDMEALQKEAANLKAELVLERQKATLFHHRLRELAGRWMATARALRKGVDLSDPSQPRPSTYGDCALDLMELVAAEAPDDR